MKKSTFLLMFLISTLLFNCEIKKPVNQVAINKSFKDYNYFGYNIQDPYNNLENLNDTLVLKWLKGQTAFSDEIIERIKGREHIIAFEKEMEGDTDINTKYLKITSNSKYFYLKNNLSDSTFSLYYRDGLDNEEKILVNPNHLSSNENATINYIQPNYDGSKVLINVSENGAEIGNMYIFDVTNNTLLKDVITNCWPSALGGVSWLTNNESFIYSHIPVIDSNSEEFILNTASVLYSLEQNTKKRTVLLSKNNNLNLKIVSGDFPIVSIRNQSKKYIFGRIGGARNYDDYYYAKHVSNSIEWKTLYKKEDKVKEFIIDDNDNLFFVTAQNASNYKIGKTSLVHPNFKNFETIIEEDATAVITDLVITSEGLFYIKTKNGVDARLYQLKNNTTKEISIPKQSGNIRLISNGSRHKQLWIKIEGWTNKIERYKYNFEDEKFKRDDLYPSNASNKLNDFIVKEIEVTSYDGTKVPLSIIHKKNLVLDSNNPVLITGYGAYGISDTPYLDKHMYHWVNNGGVYAISHSRGGGEKGDAWHKGGYKKTKPNTWKDFIACTEYLISENYSSPKKVAAWSASAGGILIGRAITERPDLYAAAIIKVGILNTLRNEFGANGKNGIKEFGTVSDSLEFKYLLEMDAYHHIKENTNYPAIFLTAGLNDSRISAWQPAKFAARMQASTISERPVLLSVDFEGGHGFDNSENKRNKELADVLTFAFWQTGHPDFQPRK